MVNHHAGEIFMLASLLFSSAPQCSPQFFHSRFATTNLVVSVGQTTRQSINYLYVNEKQFQ